MSAPKPRRRGVFVPPEGWIRASIVLVENDFFARVPTGRSVRIMPIGERQAWNFNVSLDMEIYVTVEAGKCILRRRVFQNKMFVQI